MIDTALTIDTKKVIHNISILSKKTVPILMVKANCYGMGEEAISALIEEGYDFFGVSRICEAMSIVEKSDSVKILIVAPIDANELQKITNPNIKITIATLEQLNQCQPHHIIHLKFDVGMGRIGFSKNDLEAIKRIVLKKNLNIEGLYSHLPCASNDEISNVQIEEFRKIVNIFGPVKYIHMQNSLATIKYDIDFVNVNRIGIAIWGYLETREAMDEYGKELIPAIELHAKVEQNKYFKGKISYDFTEEVEGNISTIAIGHHDGFKQSNQGFIFGNNAKVVGTVCMCHTMLLVDEFIEEQEIFGEQENLYNLLEYGKIGMYEFLVGLAPRIQKKIKGLK